MFALAEGIECDASFPAWNRAIYIVSRPCTTRDDSDQPRDFISRFFIHGDLEGMTSSRIHSQKETYAPLYRQKISGRQVVVTKEPELHLIRM